MYQQDQKAAYLNDCAMRGADRTQIKKIALVFSHVEPREEAFGADVSRMSADQAQAVACSGALAKTRICTEICILRAYAKWCIINGLASEESGFLRYEPEDIIRKTKEEFVSGEDHLQRFLDGILAPEEEGRSDNLLRLCAWMSYAGVFYDKLDEVQVSDVDLDNLTVVSDGRAYKLSRLAEASLRFAVLSDKIAVDHPQYRFRSRIESPYLLRGSRSVLKSRDVFNRLRIVQKKAFGGQKRHVITSYDLYRSGRFADMYAMERSGFFPDFAADADEFMRHNESVNARLYKSRGEKSREINLRQIKAVILEDYSRWKLAFTPS